MSEETEEFLEHYGVRGQKWGVRRALSRSKGRVTPRPSDEGRVAGKILSKQKTFGTSSLTNHELRVVNARAKLEIEFQKNFPPPKNKIKKGQDFAKELISIAETASKGVDVYNKLSSKGKKVADAALK